MTGDHQMRRFPAMAISDLIVLTVAVGFAFACVAPNYQDALSKGDVSTLRVVPDLIEYLSDGLLLFALIVLARQRIRGSADWFSPGHWIIVAMGPYSVLSLASFLFRPILHAYLPRRLQFVNAGDDVLFVLVLGLSVIASLPALRKLEIRWRICLALVQFWLLLGAIWCGIDAAGSLALLNRTFWGRHLTAVFTSAQFVATAAILISFAVDTAKGTSRDWLHYIGLAAFVLRVGSAVADWGWLTVQWWRDLFDRLLS